MLDEARTALRAGVVGDELPHAAPARQPGVRRRGIRGRIEPNDPGINARLTFELQEDIAAPYVAKGARPQVAILREQGVNSQVEMAAAFHRAGFTRVDVHMSDILARPR